MVEAKEETDVARSHLQQCDFVLYALLERWTSLCVEAQNRTFHEMFYGSLGSVFADYNFYTPLKDCSRQVANEVFVVIVNYFLHHR